MVASRLISLIGDSFVTTVLDEKTLDITDKSKVTDFFSKNNFDIIANFAAFTNVDAAEKESGDTSGLAYKLNVEGAKNLAEVCLDKDKFLVHISTDFVFRGSQDDPGPYAEDALIPQNSDGIGWYGWTKNLAEKEISKMSGLRSAVIRYGYPFRADNFEQKKDWARNLLMLYNDQKLYPLFNDQVQSILLIDDLAKPFLLICEKETNGVFHIASSDTVTPYEAGKYLLENYAKKDIPLAQGSMEDFLKVPGRTPRPRLGGLDVSLTEERLGLEFRTWREMIDEFLLQSS